MLVLLLETMKPYGVLKIAPIKGLIFDNVTISNELIDDINDFNHNKYVDDIKFR